MQDVRGGSLKLTEMSNDDLVYFFELWARGRKNVDEAKAELLSRLSGERWVKVEDGLPEEDERVLIAVRSEADDHATGVRVSFPDVSTGIIYSSSQQVIAVLDNGEEYERSDILGWRPLPAPPSEPSREKCPNCEVGLCGVHGNTSAGRGNQPREGRE